MALGCLLTNPSGILKGVTTGGSRFHVFLGIGSLSLIEMGWELRVFTDPKQDAPPGCA